jgi:predicted O-methyltransferase YrrM
MACSGPDVRVTTIEVNEDHKAVAEEAIEHAGLSSRIEVLLGAGVDVLPTLRKEVESGERPKFDFVFIDADKPNNLNYYNEAMLMCRSRACIIVDNVVRRGRVADLEAAFEDDSVAGARKVIEVAGMDGRLREYTSVSLNKTLSLFRHLLTMSPILTFSGSNFNPDGR